MPECIGDLWEEKEPAQCATNLHPDVRSPPGVRYQVGDHALIPLHHPGQDPHGQPRSIPRINMNTDADDKTIPVQIRRRQFPVRPAFAMTINKSQGQTFQEIAIYLPAPVFAHGKLYVALSRVGYPRKITILITHPPLPNQPRASP